MGAGALLTANNDLSWDHLQFINENSVQIMSRNDTIAVLLPGAFYFLGERQKPPIELFRQYGVKMALATDLNPGSSPTASLTLMMNMACRLFSLTVAETWQAVTTHAARALGLVNYGELAPGCRADIVRW